MQVTYLGIAASAMFGALCGYLLKSSNSKSNNENASDSIGDHVDVVVPHEVLFQASSIRPDNEWGHEPYTDHEDATKSGLKVRLSFYREVVGKSATNKSIELGYKFQVFLNGIPFSKGQTVPVRILGENATFEEEIEAVEIVAKRMRILKTLDPAIVDNL